MKYTFTVTIPDSPEYAVCELIHRQRCIYRRQFCLANPTDVQELLQKVVNAASSVNLDIKIQSTPHLWEVC